MNEVPHTPKIARAQAMQFAFGLSHGEMAVLFPSYPNPAEGRAWDKRPREQQRAAMMWVLNQLFFATFCGFPVGDSNPETRRTLLLKLCRERATLLQDNLGWSMHEVMDWLIEANESACWSERLCDF